MEKLLKLMEIRNDYMLHFFYGWLIVNILDMFFDQKTYLIVIASIAIGKEVYDYFHPNHSFDLLDIVWTMLPLLFKIKLSIIDK